MIGSLELRIECDSGKLLGRLTADGVEFWCEKHRRQETRTLEWLTEKIHELRALRASVNPPEVRVTMGDHTEARYR